MTRYILLLPFVFILVFQVNAQVQIRDTTIVWQHHKFTLDEDHGMQSWSVEDEAIQEVVFDNAKVIENELIRLVIVPEYGARIISFYYKPTAHEYLYQSPLGSPYGMNDSNFYYDWLMVWGGIFPTFPEPEHGKAWLIPWELEIIKNTSDTVAIQMSYTDDISFVSAPRNFNNGTTNITCQVSVSVYKNSAAWDFDVALINNQPQPKNYEYWTCTTLTPGSDSENTRSPLNSEMIIPADSYFAAWSPNNWIGSYDQYYPLSDITYLDDWSNMGIAYVDNRSADYWGVINHDNEEGIMRIADREETPGMKIWTWGRDNIDNDMFDFSNGGADNYIELWGGTSRAFFTDATLLANETKSWKETYVPTNNIQGVDAINAQVVANLIWGQVDKVLTCEVNTFNSEEVWDVKLYIEETGQVLRQTDLIFDPTGHQEHIDIDSLDLEPGTYHAVLELETSDQTYMMSISERILIEGVLSANTYDVSSADLVLRSIDNKSIVMTMTDESPFYYHVYSFNGQTIQYNDKQSKQARVDFSNDGIYIVKVQTDQKIYTKKIVLR